MRKIGLAAPALLLLMQCPAFGRGVSPYLPLDLDPEIEAQIERVLILGNKPVMTRPIPAATVLEALPKACKVDQGLCRRVQRYLSRYMHNRGVSYATLEGAASSGKGAASVAPNRYGMEENSHWDASAQVYLQPNDYVLIDLGAVAYEGRTTFSGSMISLGFSGAQLDLGFRPHWGSPFSDSSMLMSTEAPTMPSVTLSNYEPLTRLGLRYELFGAIMSNSNRIVFDGGYTSGKPRLAGVHVDAEPVSGWSIGVSRLLQYGGGALGGSSVRDLLDAFFSPSATQKTSVANPRPSEIRKPRSPVVCSSRGKSRFQCISNMRARTRLAARTTCSETHRCPRASTSRECGDGWTLRSRPPNGNACTFTTSTSMD